ncbi:MAG: tRNA pseudouridine(38-40) synthase TruA [Spirochaetes bacterium]|nr:MAG: tRNA pseudouridine(38-40) synthase TruA [Spirochaetota bacterium]
MEKGTGTGSAPDAPCRRIALLIQYDGTAYNGWQVQVGGLTVQGELERAIAVLTRQEKRVTGSGRTDAGVHAHCQIAHFDDTTDIPLKRMCAGLNGLLPKSISVKNAYLVPGDFHARYRAIAREYLYLIHNHPQRNPFMIHRAMWLREPLDTDYLRRVASRLIGEHDFKSFCKKISAEGNTVRRVDEIEFTRMDELVVMRIKGNAFLHNMVRSIAGTLLEMHGERREPEYLDGIVLARDRDAGGITAPPCGLYLNRVWYDPPLSSMPAAY